MIGWIAWYHSPTFDPRVFLLLVGLIASFFIGLILWVKGKPSIGGGDILAISFMLLFVPVLPELGQVIYIIPLSICTLIVSVYWNTHGKEIPFIFPFTVCHAILLTIATLI